MRCITIINELGLHARAAGKLARIAINAKAPIFLEKNGLSVDASSILDILTLNCGQGARIVIRAHDPVDKDILDQIEALINNRFGEPA